MVEWIESDGWKWRVGMAGEEWPTTGTSRGGGGWSGPVIRRSWSAGQGIRVPMAGEVDVGGRHNKANTANITNYEKMKSPSWKIDNNNKIKQNLK